MKLVSRKNITLRKIQKYLSLFSSSEKKKKKKNPVKKTNPA
jgi:hypothetical protein